MYCKNCGTEMSEQTAVCSVCGLKNEGMAIPQSVGTKQAFDMMYRMFKYERLAWKIAGIVYTVLAGVYAALGVLYLFLGIVMSADYFEGGFPVFMFGWMFMGFAAGFATVGITGLVMIKRAQRYMDEMATDIRPAIVRANSVGMIVLGVMLNTIAMVFIIINFAFAKANQTALQQIVQEQNSRTMNGN